MKDIFYTKQKQLSSIDIVFENCDSANILVKDISGVDIKISKLNKIFSPTSSVMDNNYLASHIKIDLFDIDKILVKNESLLDRISKFKDITYIIINYTDDSFDSIIIPWESNDGWSSNYCIVLIKDEDKVIDYRQWNDRTKSAPKRVLYHLTIKHNSWFRRKINKLLYKISVVVK